MTLRTGSRTERGKEPQGRKGLGFLLPARRVGGTRAAEDAANVELGRELAEIGVRLADDAYMAWLTAATDCQHALSAWRAGVGLSQADGYLAYRAALDREGAAARDLERLS